MEKSLHKRVVFNADARFRLVRGQESPGATDPGEKMATLQGYAIVWGVLSQDRGGYKVRMMPGSAKFTDPAMALYHHDYRDVIGNTANKTLRIFSDDVGVRVEIDLPDTSTGHDVEELVEKGYVSGMSFSMAELPDYQEVRENGQTILNVTSVVCDEVTVTPIPAFSETSIAIKTDEVPEDDAPSPPPQSSAEKNSEPAGISQLRLSQLRLSMLNLN